MPSRQPTLQSATSDGQNPGIRYYHIAFIAIALGAVLLLDAVTPLALLTGILYIPLIYCSLWFFRPRTAFVFAGIATILTVIGYFISPASNGVLWIGILNRVLTIAALWFVALLAYMRRKADHRIREQAEALADIDYLYRQLVDGLIGFGIYRISPEGVVASWSKSAERIKGYTAEEIIGQKFSKFYTEKDCAAGIPEQALAAAAATGQYVGEAWHLRKDGSGFMAGITIYALHSLQGKLVGFSYVTQDITELKKIEKVAEERAEALAAIDHLYRQLVDGLQGFAIYRLSPEGLVESWSKSAERMKGYAANEVIGQNFAKFYTEKDRAAGIPQHKLKTAAALGLFSSESWHVRKDGRRFMAGVVIYALRDPQGKLVGFSNITQDITARMKIEKIAEDYLAALTRSNQELDDFAYIASHDLKEPLRGISTNAIFLKEDYAEKLDEEGLKRLDRMAYLCERMEQLVNDLLYFARIGKQELAVKETDLNAVIKDIELMMETLLLERNAVITIPKLLPTISCDATRVTEVFRNLITNAVKYNRSKDKSVEIGCVDRMEDKSGTVASRVFYVRDNGIGIDKEYQEEVFTIFKRLNEEEGDEKGTGVGLTFVRKIVERHDGHIWVESEPGKGSTFYFTLNDGVAT